MTKLVIVPSCRPMLMRRFLEAKQKCRQLDDWGVVLIAQAYTDHELGNIAAACHHIWRIADRAPVYPLRVEAMQRYEADIYVNCDDDMIPLPGLTNWDVMAGKLMREQDIGVISGNWVRSHAFLKKKGLVEEYVWQPITNMAGGQMYRREVARWLADNPYCPVAPYMFDDIQASLTAYVGGWKNARYRGSLLIHNILSPDGLKVQFNSDSSLRRPDPSLIRSRPSPHQKYEADNNYYMPVVGDVQPMAHELHHTNREARFGAL